MAAQQNPGHNGWTNYETWCVSLLIDNEESSKRYWAREARAARIFAKEEGSDPASLLAQSLKDEITDQAPELDGMWADLLNAALSEVNWYEIAEHLLAE